MVKRITLAVFTAFMLFGCAAKVNVASNKDANYREKLDRLLVIVRLDQAGMNSDYVRQSFLAKFATKGVAVESVAVNQLALDVNYQKQVAEKFQPRQVMDLVPTDVFKNRFGRVASFTVESNLIDVATKKLVWRSSVKFWNSEGGSAQENAETLADSVIVKLQEDGLL